MRLACVLMIAACLGLPAGEGATYWVATDGDDANPGSAEEPFRTLQRAVDAAGPGDTVIVRDGVYGRAGCRSDSDYAVNIDHGGTPSAYLAIRAENKWRAVLDGEQTCHSYINLGRGAAYISIENFIIRRSYWSALWSNADAHDILVRGNSLEQIGNWLDTTTPYAFTGLYTGTGNSNFVIDGNVFHDIGRRSGSYNHDHGLYLHGTGFTITNNVFYNMKYGWPIQTAEGFGNALIANNTFAFPLSARDGHIVLWETNFNIAIRNNIFYSPRRCAIVRVDSTVSGCRIENNIVYGAASLIDDPSGCTLAANRVGLDPRFIRTESEPYNFHLRPDSPAIGAGLALAEVKTDFDGRPRGRETVTAGAYEVESSGAASRKITPYPVGPIR
jgi:hypothetical protein